MIARRPKSLFKYRRFSDKLLAQLCYDQIYYADPATFNDPLDCLPVVEPDLPTPELEALLAQLVINRSAKDIDAAMKKLRLRGENATARRDKLTETEVRRLVGDINYNATNPDIDDRHAYIRNAFSQAIERELRKTHETGVLCLSAKCNSLLMWSHYADQHRGICVEYDVSHLGPESLHAVSYGKSRKVCASWISNWLMNDDRRARSAINEASLLTKSKEWAYEREWRLLGRVGLSYSPARLKSIIFGMRCPEAVMFAILKTLEGRKGIKFWRIAQPSDHFKLKRVRPDIDEMMATMPRTSALDEFENIELVEPSAVPGGSEASIIGDRATPLQ